MGGRGEWKEDRGKLECVRGRVKQMGFRMRATGFRGHERHGFHQGRTLCVKMTGGGFCTDVGYHKFGKEGISPPRREPSPPRDRLTAPQPPLTREPSSKPGIASLTREGEASSAGGSAECYFGARSYVETSATNSSRAALKASSVCPAHGLLASAPQCTRSSRPLAHPLCIV